MNPEPIPDAPVADPPVFNVVPQDKQRRLAFKAAVVLYLLALLDMGINVLISGVVGWRT